MSSSCPNAFRRGVSNNYCDNLQLQINCTGVRFVCRMSVACSLPPPPPPIHTSTFALLSPLLLPSLSALSFPVVHQQREKDAVTFVELHQRLSAQVQLYYIYYECVYINTCTNQQCRTPQSTDAFIIIINVHTFDCHQQVN